MGEPSKEINPLIIEIMEKHPEWIDINILLNSSLVRINERQCDYCNYYSLREKISEFLKKQKNIDWNQYVVNANFQTPISVKVNTDNKHLLLLMLNQLNEPIPKQQGDLMNFTMEE